jgi:hypothetical protein
MHRKPVEREKKEREMCVFVNKLAIYYLPCKQACVRESNGKLGEFFACFYLLTLS